LNAQLFRGTGATTLQIETIKLAHGQWSLKTLLIGSQKKVNKFYSFHYLELSQNKMKANNETN